MTGTNKSEETNQGGMPGIVRVDRLVRPPLADRLHDLNALLLEDEGRNLDAGCVERATDFATRHTEPDTVSAGYDGSVYFSWGSELSMQFSPFATHWAGKANGARPYGSGEPDVMEWPCLRPNVRGNRLAP